MFFFLSPNFLKFVLRSKRTVFCSEFNGSDGVGSAGDGAERGGRRGGGEVRDGPEADGRAVAQVPDLQRIGSGHVHMCSVVRWRFRVPFMCRVGSDVVQKLRRRWKRAADYSAVISRSTQPPVLRSFSNVETKLNYSMLKFMN